MKSTLRCAATKIEFASGATALVVDLTIDCPACGPIAYRVPGHHLRALRNALIEVIDLHPDPELSGSEGTVLERTGFEGRSPEDPTEN